MYDRRTSRRAAQAHPHRGAHAETLEPRTLLAVNAVTPNGTMSAFTHDHVSVVSGGILFFVANDDVHGKELWRSDGTAGGTYLVKDVRPGPKPTPLNGGITRLIDAGGTVFFTAYNEQLGEVMWRSDGTTGGTRPVVRADDPARALPAGIHYALGSRAVVFGNNNLWSVDAAGVATLIFQPSSNTAPSIAGGLAYFQHQGDLWRTDGTAAGTIPIAAKVTLNNGAGVLQHAGHTYFSVHTLSGTQLWRTDGTAAGTSTFAVLPPGPNYHRWLGALGDKLFFAFNTSATGVEMFITDGTAAGTGLFADLYPGPVDSLLTGFRSDPTTGLAYFIARDATHGMEPWVTDGTPAGTHMLADLAPGSAASNPSGFRNFAGSLYFVAAPSPDSGAELFRTDGTTAGTVQAVDVFPGPTGAFASARGVVNGDLLFVANHPSYGKELWRTDGTQAGTALVRDVNETPVGPTPKYLTAFNGSLYYQASHAEFGAELWRTDGTAAGTGLVKDIAGGATASSPSYLTVSGGALYFATDEGFTGSRLWRSDGTPGGTTALRAFARPVGGAMQVRSLYDFRGTLYFAASGVTGTTGVELWTSDGTAAGTAMVADLDPGTYSGSPRNFTAVGDTLYFVADTRAHGAELWRTDGTADGTRMVADLNGGLGSNPFYLANVNGTLYFMAWDAGGYRLWKTDGTAAGTVPVRSLFAEGPDASSTTHLSVDGLLYFVARDPDRGQELWRSDGTPDGTFGLGDLRPGAAGSDPRSLTAAGGFVYFTANDGAHGAELWRTDGTPAGTAMVKDLRAGPDGSDPAYLTTVGDRLYFSAGDAEHGRTLWQSDGTAAGTVVIAGAAGSAASSANASSAARQLGAFPAPFPAAAADDDDAPLELTNVGGKLFYTTGGMSIWTVTPEPTPTPTTTTVDFAVGDGGVQRSIVRSVTARFSQPVALSADAFTLSVPGGPSGTGQTPPTPGWSNPSGDGRTYELTFAGSGVDRGSLPDGAYELVVNASAVRVSGQPGLPGLAGNVSLRFHRLFSDADGDGDSDGLDLSQFRRALDKSRALHPTAYKWYFDHDDDGVVDATDLSEVRTRRSVSYAGHYR